MRFDLEQEELRRTVRTLLERAADDDVWRLLAEQVGAHSLAIPEEYGGAGFSVLETHVVLEELGAALVAPGFLSTTLAAQAILAAGSHEAGAALLPGIAEGRTRATMAWSESGSWERSAIQTAATTTDAGGWTVTGTKDHVLDGADADLFVVPARIAEAVANADAEAGAAAAAENAADPANAATPRLGLFAVTATDADVSPRETVDPNRPQAIVSFRHSPATPLNTDASAILEHVMDLACVAISAEQVGAAQRAFDLTLAYAKQRVQFGRPIGAFQAVKHRLADLYTLLESARSASYAAAFASPDELRCAASRAKAYCSEAFSTIAGEAIQLHGGIGITWEHPIHLYFKRAHATAQLFGSPARHRRRYAEAVGLAGPRAAA